MSSSRKGGPRPLDDRRFVDALLDPGIIPGIFNYCDQWCAYCPMTARCLAYRCSSEVRGDPAEAPATVVERLYESLRFVRQLRVAEGQPQPALDALLSRDPVRLRELVAVDDPLERIGRRYAGTASRYLLSHPAFPCDMSYRPSGPAPLEVLAWFHVFIAAKIYRAVIGSLSAARGGDDGALSDALGSAKIALIAIDRSAEAVAALRREDEDARLEHVEAQLRRLKREVEARFPGARAFRRPGLDE